jgi:hypothetical protein
VRTQMRVIPAVVLSGAMFASVLTASADVISSTATLPVLGVPYTSTTHIGCLPPAGFCVSPGSFTLNSVVSSLFNLAGQDITSNISFTGTLTALDNTLIGPLSLSGTIEEEVLGRTFRLNLVPGQRISSHFL